MKKWVFILLLFIEIITLPNIFLFTPQPDDWNFYRYKNTWGFPVVIDASGFIHPAINLNVLLNPKEFRQSRPLYMVIGHWMGNSTEWAIQAVKPSLFKTIKENCRKELVLNLQEHGDPLETTFAYYIGFVLFNFILLILSALFFADLIEITKIPKTLALCIFSILLVNDVTKTFLWTVHQQMFTILTPILMIWWVTKYCIISRTTNLLFYLVYSLIMGTLLLAYGNIILLLPTIFVGFLISHEWNFINMYVIKSLVGTTLCFALPSVLWIIYVTQKAGFYYNFEISEFRQLIWPIDYLKNLGVLKTGFIFLVYTKNFLTTFLYLDIIPFIVLFVTLYRLGIISLSKKDVESIWKEPNENTAFIVVFFIGFIFFLLLGYYRPRITFFLVVPILIYMGIAIKDIWKNKTAKILTLSFTTIWIVKHYWTIGPYM